MEIEELVKRWIPHIKVIKPEELKEKIAKDLEKHLGGYDTGSLDLC